MVNVNARELPVMRCPDLASTPGIYPLVNRQRQLTGKRAQPPETFE